MNRTMSPSTARSLRSRAIKDTQVMKRRSRLSQQAASSTYASSAQIEALQMRTSRSRAMPVLSLTMTRASQDTVAITVADAVVVADAVAETVAVADAVAVAEVAHLVVTT